MKEKRILGGRKEVRVATAQAAPVFMDKEKTIEKVSGLMAEAAKGGAQLVVFPETFIPTYPAWYTGGWESQPREWAPYMVALQDNAVVVGSRDTEALGEAARAANIYAAIGINELDDRTGSRTVYNTLIFMGPDGKVLGRHRKLMPTYTERTYWGWGDASDLFVLDTDIGRIGGLICGENMMILLKAAMMHRGEEFHIAVWPGAWSAHGKTSLMDPETDTLEVLRSYGETVGADPAVWSFGRLETPALQDLLDLLGVKRIPSKGTLMHSMRILVLDGAGQIVHVEKDNNWEQEALLAQVQAVSAPKQP